MMCTTHTTERKLYCRTCQDLCCPLCAAPGNEHHRHDVVLRDAAHQELIATLRDNIAKLQAALPVEHRDQLRELVARLEETRVRVLAFSKIIKSTLPSNGR